MGLHLQSGESNPFNQSIWLRKGAPGEGSMLGFRKAIELRVAESRIKDYKSFVF